MAKTTNDFDIIKMDEYEDISSGYEDISSSSKKGKKYRKKKRKSKALRILCIVLCVLLVSIIGFFIYGYSLIDSVPKAELDESDLGITTSEYDGIKNIALLGIDSRKNNSSGRSDAVVVLSINKKSSKIKLISIARDSYVAVDGYGHDKLTHAYAKGKSQLSVKTLNQNFGLEITDYVTMNFFQFVHIIDYVGGVTIDVDEKEMNEMNKNIIPYLDEMGIKGEKLTKTGLQRLSGAQALCYARIRKTDSDIMRGNRQKEVIAAVFDEMKSINITKLPTLADMFLSECETSLSTSDIVSLGTFALSRGLQFEEISIPNDNIDSKGKIISGVWYYWLDLEQARADIYDFIFDKNYYSPEQKALREQEKNKK